MSLGHGSTISRNGLMLYYDVANSKSYPGTGTVLANLADSPNANLLNGVTVNSNFGKYLAFDGVNDLVNTATTVSISSQTVTASAWVRVVSHGNWHNYINNNWVNSGWLLFSSSTQWIFGVANTNQQYNASINHNNSTAWTHLVGTYDGVASRLYVNGVYSGFANISTLTLDTGFTINIGGGTRPSAYDIGPVLVYNRAITQTEVTQLYESTRGRYGI